MPNCAPPSASFEAWRPIISGREFREPLDNFVLLRLGQRGVKWDGHGARVMRFRVGIFAGPEAQLAEIRMHVKRNVVNLHADPGSPQRGEGFGARDAERLFVPANDIEMPG